MSSSAWAKNAGSGFDTPRSWDIAMTSAVTPSARSSGPRADGWLAMIATRYPRSSSAPTIRGASGYRSSVRNPPNAVLTAAFNGRQSGTPSEANASWCSPPRAMTAPRTAMRVRRGTPITSAQVDQMRVSSIIVSPTSRQTQRFEGSGTSLGDRSPAATSPSASWPAGPPTGTAREPASRRRRAGPPADTRRSACSRPHAAPSRASRRRP